MTTLVFGHKSPDTDSVCSAIAFAALQNELGGKAEAVRLGEINKETEFILDYFNLEQPRFITRVDEGQKIALVDHNEAAQSVANRENAEIVQIVDHHRIDLSTASPMNIRIEAVGCTATIISKLYTENGLTPGKKVAGIMLSAILSDTLLFKSPTCTDEDVKQAKKLAEIAELDYDKYGMDMLIAGTSLGNKSAEEIYHMDMKPFKFGSQRATIAQVNTVDIKSVLEKKDELEAVMTDLMKKENLDFTCFMITDIVNKGTELFIVGDKTLSNKAFGMDINAETIYLEGVVSRKKQIVPPLTEVAK